MSGPSPEDMSHAMLLALLMHHGGSYTLPASAFETDAIGGPDGAFHAVEMTPLPDGRVQLAVVVRPDVDGSGITYT
ncbi:pRL2-19 [Streptomyces sp. NPDC091272]|uniref:pRL2-19 n=1 Tax=Streptomyces sp. NPDC091272 TaxID=3365981 RepID=UPI00381B6461